MNDERAQQLYDALYEQARNMHGYASGRTAAESIGIDAINNMLEYRRLMGLLIDAGRVRRQTLDLWGPEGVTVEELRQP